MLRKTDLRVSPFLSCIIQEFMGIGAPPPNLTNYRIWWPKDSSTRKLLLIEKRVSVDSYQVVQFHRVNFPSKRSLIFVSLQQVWKHDRLRRFIDFWNIRWYFHSNGVNCSASSASRKRVNICWTKSNRISSGVICWQKLYTLRLDINED